MTENEIKQQARRALNQQAEALDATTLHQLRKARQTALLKSKQPFFSLKLLGGAGAGLAIATIFVFMTSTTLLQSDRLSPFDDLEMLTAETDIELYTQFEFYEWLGESLDEG